MREPHVVKLFYQLKSGEKTSFSDPPPIEESREKFNLRLEEGQLVIEMKDHYPTAEDARQIVEPFLRSWEIDYALTNNQPEIEILIFHCLLRR